MFIIDTSGEDVPSPQIPDHISADLERMADWLISNGRDEFMTVYGRVRGSVLLRSLQMLKEHQRSVSGGSVQGIHTSTSSPMLVRIFLLCDVHLKNMIAYF